jgi:putative SOS response-associated peptidase YedK
MTVGFPNANEIMQPIHSRMPVILHEGNFNRWLERGEAHQPPSDLLRLFLADEMEAFEVNKDVGNQTETPRDWT